MRGVRRKSFPVLLPGPTHGPLSGPREVPPLNACRGKMAVAAEVSGEVLTAEISDDQTCLQAAGKAAFLC